MSKQKKVLFYGILRPKRSPSQRYRIEQFFSTLDQNHVTYDYAYLLSKKKDENLYAPGKYFQKIWILIHAISRLTYDWLFKVKNYEYVFVERELLMLGTSFFERKFAKKAKLIYDFDDALWLLDVSEANKKLAFLKNPEKISKIISCAHLVVAGNEFLANYAKQFNENVKIIPTVLDTNHYKRSSELAIKPSNRVCIGWSGSHTTIEHFKTLIPTLQKLKLKYEDQIYFKIIGDPNFCHEGLNIQGLKWTEETEIRELEEIDIGIMPLPNDKWSNGKCGLKGLVYMSMGIPNLMSHVGVNSTIVHHGNNGYLCNNEADWLETFDLLIHDFSLRQKIGKTGRETIIERYSVEAVKQDFLDQFNF
jgi:glycosyltransferase involved in cell wall biosynthesis